MIKNEFDWYIQFNKIQNLNDMIGEQLECVDAERLAHTRQKKIRSKKRKDTFVAAKRRHNLCASRGVSGKHTAEGFMKKGYTHGSFHENPYSHYAKHGLKNKAPAKNYSISTYRRECAVENKMMEYMSEEPEKFETYFMYDEGNEGDIFYHDLLNFIRTACSATEEELADCGIVEMMVIAYQLGEAKRFGINEDDVTAPCVTYDDWGDPITQYKPIRLHSTAQKLLNRGWADNYTAIEDNQWWEDFCDFDWQSL